MQDEFKKITLDNGLRVILAHLPAFRSTTAIVLCGTGSRYETKATNGISHFLEHMFFKGTNKRPSAMDISHALDEVGADYNAFTGKESTGYYIKAASVHLPLALDMLSDMVWNSKFDESEIERERGVIIEEINMYEDTPMRRVAEIFEQVLWGDQPLGWDIAGKKEVIRRVKKGDFLDYISNRYAPNNMVVALAGNFDGGKGLSLVKEYFGQKARHKVKSFSPVLVKQTKPTVRAVYKKTDQAHLVVGVHGFKLGTPERYNVALLSTILGGGMSSRLFVNVREKRGLAYYVRADHEAYLDAGAFAASAGVDLKRIDDAIQVILLEFLQIAQKPVGEKELKKAKEYLKGRLILSWEDSRTVASTFGIDELMEGRVRTLEEFLKKIDEVEAQGIQRVAKQLFVGSKLNLAVIGPFKDQTRFEKILKL